MKACLYLVLFSLVALVVSPAYAQFTDPADSVTIYGAVLDAESITPVPYTSVYVKNKPKGAVTDSAGYFTIQAVKSDTLLFSAVGYKRGTMVLPGDLPEDRYSMIQLMLPDTLLLDEVVITSYPTFAEFKEAFANTKVSDDEPTSPMALQRELDNLLYETYKNDRYYYDYMRYNRLYRMTGIFPPNNFINPLTWANFIRDWRDGRYETEAPLPERMPRRGVNLIDDDQ
ncbi:carboxypeptidase-like regulatory domain-containing protein [Roseivirga sp. BDSF3-8]|uniref:carboxypeptidase-like regulatory domain-containing protein n=1 Tax=Roseivirga sp. BDSF3-8 TaxID=3241598 RepID=UPI0035327515